MTKVKIGLALGGGGARGSYQIGILKALRDIGILKKIHHISGTSIGAINTLMVISNLSYNRMLEVWHKIDNQQVYGENRFKLDRHGMFSLQDIFQTLSKEISLSEIRKSKIHGYATAAKMKKDSLIDQILIYRMEREVFHLNEIEDPHRAVLASSSIPVVFGPTSIDDQAYVDGGVVDNHPIQPLIDAGCNVIIAVPIDGTFKAKKYNQESILLINIETQLRFKKIPIDILDFNPDLVNQNADYGYKMGLHMIQKLIDKGLFKKRTKSFIKPTDHCYVDISKEEEIALKKEFDLLESEES